MVIPPNLQAEANSLVYQYLQNVDKQSAQLFLKNTKAVSDYLTNNHVWSRVARVFLVLVIPIHFLFSLFWFSLLFKTAMMIPLKK